MLNADFFCANGRRPPNDCSCDGNAGTRCDLNVVGTVNCTEGGTEVVLTYDFPSWRIVRVCVCVCVCVYKLGNYAWCCSTHVQRHQDPLLQCIDGEIQGHIRNVAVESRNQISAHQAYSGISATRKLQFGI